MPLEPGQTIGDYEVLSPLGAGGIGEVYKVRHVISQRTEAMKFLRSDRTGGELPERFLREIRVLASLSHPHIARLHTAFKVDDQIAMVMEFIEGEDLHWKLRSAWPGRAVEGIEYVRQVLSALEYAHARDVIHRDIKPSNIMITPEGQAKLLDFGMAFKAADLSVTRPGFILGSLHYMSPEQVRGERVDARSDLYSTGVTLYEILTGRRPSMADRIRDHDRPSSESSRNGLRTSTPPYLTAFRSTLLKALAKEPARAVSECCGISECLDPYFAGRSGDAANARHPAGLAETRPRTGKTSVRLAWSAKRARICQANPETLDPAVLDSVSRELAAFIGPIAKVVVKRAAERCSSVDDLYGAVAGGDRLGEGPIELPGAQAEE